MKSLPLLMTVVASLAAPASALDVLFDSFDCQAPWTQGLKEGRGKFQTDEGGRKFLRVDYTGGVVGNEGGVQMKCALPPADEQTAEYSVRFGDGFEWVRGGKLPGLCGGKCNTGGKIATAGDGWSARYMWRPNGRVVIYLYHMDQPTMYGEDLPLDSAFVTGRWYTLREHLKMNTPGKADGVLQVWIDGRPVLDRKDIRFRADGSVHIDTFYFSTFFGGHEPDWAAKKAEHADFASIKIGP